jgi:hypothetical protein
MVSNASRLGPCRVDNLVGLRSADRHDEPWGVVAWLSGELLEEAQGGLSAEI